MIDSNDQTTGVGEPPPANPYSPPKTDVAVAPGTSEELFKIAKAQKMVIYAILGYILAIVSILVVPALPETLAAIGSLAIIAVYLITLVTGVVGTYRLANSLGNSPGMSVLIVLLFFLPCIGLLGLLVLNGQATSRLKAGGWHVGFLGANAPK